MASKVTSKVNSTRADWKQGLGYALVTAIMWGLLPITLKGVLDQMDPVTITWYRFSVSAGIALFWYGRHSGSAIKQLFSREHIAYTVLAISGLLCNYLLYLFGLSYITPGAAQIVIQLAPLLLLIGSVVFFSERLTPFQWLGVVTFSVGLLLFFHHRVSQMVVTDGQYLLGIALIIGASVAWATYGLAQKRLLGVQSSRNILLVLYLAGTLFFLPFSAPAQVLSLNGIQLALLAFVSLNTIIAYGCFGRAMTCWQASSVSATITLAPLFTLVFVSLINFWQPGLVTAEPLDLLNWTGALLVVVGSVLAALARSARVR